MKFELNDYKRELTDEEILDNIRLVADSLDTDYLSISLYKKHGKYSQTAIQGHFGTWKSAVILAGLRHQRNDSELKLIKDEDYFQDIRRVSSEIAKDTVPYEEYIKRGKYSAEYIFTRFGKWNDFLNQAGLKCTGFSKEKITEEQCFDEIERIWRILGRQPTSTDIIKSGISNYSIDTFKRRFGGWRKALEAFVNYINTNDSLDEDITEKNDSLEKNTNSKVRSINDETIVVEESEKNVHRTSRNINTRLRFRVLKRDCFKCCACGASPAKDVSVELHVDHIIPWSKGGETVIDNLQTLCSKCNLGKSNIL
jgi:hypothetical protein